MHRKPIRHLFENCDRHFSVILAPRSPDFQILVSMTYISSPHPLLTGFWVLSFTWATPLASSAPTLFSVDMWHPSYSSLLWPLTFLITWASSLINALHMLTYVYCWLSMLLCSLREHYHVTIAFYKLSSNEQISSLKSPIYNVEVTIKSSWLANQAQ